MDHQHQGRYVPADTNSGWGFAAIIVGIALACVVLATVVHQRTYKHPTDVRFQTPSAAAKTAGAAQGREH